MKKTLFLIALLAWAPMSNADDIDLEQYRGKVVVLDFWASWCVPCRRSFPWMNDMQARYADEGLVILAVNLDREREEADRFLAKYPAAFNVAFDPDGSVAKRYEVQVMPSSLVIDRNGEIIARHAGFKVKQIPDYERIVTKALAREDAE